MTAGIKANSDGSGAIQVGGTDVIGLGAAGQWGIGGANYGTTGQVLTSAGASAAPTWAAPAGFPAGTAMMFVQTAAPTGWTKSTTHNDKALRVVSGAASSGGSVAFTTAFASQSVAGTVGNFTLTSNEIPAHLHGISATTVGALSPGGETIPRSVSNPGTLNTRNTGGGAAHSHTFTGTAINLAVQYVDVIIATKD